MRLSPDHFPLLAVTIPLAGLVGIFVGSFLNAVVYRAPRSLSVVAPRSFCPTCQRQLTWWENVPVVSWVGLRGRCRTCRQPISPRYPLVELSTGAIFALVTWGWDGTVLAAAYCALAATMVAVALIEYGGDRAPLVVAAAGTGLGQVILVVGAGWLHHWAVVVGSLVGTSAAVAVYATLRQSDPDCTDPRWHGRGALLVAGCWTGGLGLTATAVGAVAWIAAYFACMVGRWVLVRRHPRRVIEPVTTGVGHPLYRAPMVTAIAVAMAASLVTGG